MPERTQGELPQRLVDDISAQNPWWRGDVMPPLPTFKRWPFNWLRRRILDPIAPIIVLRGTRQIGKTTIQLQLIEDLLAGGIAPTRILRFQYDQLPSLQPLMKNEPILRVSEWYEKAILKQSFNLAARSGKPAFLFLDEVQNLNDWDIQLKSLVDRAAVRVVVTGSSALRIAYGRDSLAGRIQMVEIGPLRLREISELRHGESLPPYDAENGFNAWSTADFWNGLNQYADRHATQRDAAFKAFAERGGYPLAHRSGAGWQEIANQLNETVVKRVIEHDLRIGERGRRRDETLLREVFGMTARYCGQSPAIRTMSDELQQTLAANVGSQRLRAYLQFLDGALLVRLIEPLEIRLKRKRGAAKLCLSDHAVRSAWLGESVPLDPADLGPDNAMADISGRIVESIVGYFLASLGLTVQHRPERGGDPEVDFVVTIGDHRVPVEVKYRSVVRADRDSAGLLDFLGKPLNRAPIGLLVTRTESVVANLDPRIIVIPLRSLLLVR